MPVTTDILINNLLKQQKLCEFISIAIDKLEIKISLANT